MKQLDYEDLSPAQLDQVSFCESTDPALTKPHECRWVLDDDGALIGYRRPAMFRHNEAVKWMDEVISIETGNAIPLLDAEDLKEKRPPKKKAAVAVAEDARAGNAENSDTQWIALHDIAVTTNVRKNFPETELVEMRNNFMERGFLPEISRLLVRPNPRAGEKGQLPFELVLGGRRYRGASDVGISPVPCAVRAMNDTEMLELQLVENIKRRGLTPLDEAEGICHLLDLRDENGKAVHTVQSLSKRLDCSPTHISECRSLRRLRNTPAGDAVDSGKLLHKHGILLAKVHDAAKRDELTNRVLHTSDGRGALPAETLAEWIKDEVMIQLRGLEFNPDDADLVPPHFEQGERLWGSDCGSCPQNSKNGTDDVRDTRAVPMCTHPPCFKAKVAAAQKQWRAAMEEKGCKVLSPEEAEKIIDPQTGTRLAASSGYVELCETPATWEVREGIAPPPWNKLIKGRGVTTTVFRDAKGTVHEVVERELAIRAAVENQHNIFRASEKAAKVEEPTTPLDQEAIPAVERAAEQNELAARIAEEQAEKARLSLRSARIVEAQFLAVVEAARGTKIPDGFWLLAMHAVMRVIDEQGDLGLLAERHGFTGDHDHACDWMMKKAAKLEPPFRLSFLTELLISVYMALEAEQELPKWAKVFGVDLRAVKRDTEKRLNAEEAAAAEAEEIKNGVAWSSEKKGVEFTWEGHTVTNPDVAAVAIPGGKFNVLVAVAHHVKGWVFGWSVEETKKKGKTLSEECQAGGTTYGNRVLAFRTGLLACRKALGELGAPPQAIQRIEAYLAAVEAPAGKKPAKNGGKK